MKADKIPSELCKHKQLRLLEYDYSSSGAYFVAICVHTRRHLFGEKVFDGPILWAHLRVRP